jgi:hypothetical protein
VWQGRTVIGTSSIRFAQLRIQWIMMTQVDRGTIRKVTSGDLEVGLICADRDGNRVRIDRVDRESTTVAYHFLNDELRVQEGVREVPVEEFLAEGWYLA